MSSRGRPSGAERLGYDVELQEQPGGLWRAIVTDDGDVLFDRDGYKNEQSAKQGVGTWVRREHGDQLAPPPRSNPRPAPVRPTGQTLVVDNLAADMEQTADDQDNRAMLLRQQADRLEGEAKRLRVAAEVLRGPDGDG